MAYMGGEWRAMAWRMEWEPRLQHKTLSESASYGMSGSNPRSRGQPPVQVWEGRVWVSFFLYSLVGGLQRAPLYCISARLTFKA